MRDGILGKDGFFARFSARAILRQADGKAQGEFQAVCQDRNGKVLWLAKFPNLLTQIGKAFLLDEALASSAYTAASYMGLISSASFTGVSGGDTMSSHSGWLEAGSTNAPTYSGSRQTCVWSASTTSGGPSYTATKSLSTGLIFTFTGSGTVEGGFIVTGSGASATIGNTGGTLYAAGTLATVQPVVSTNTLTMFYTTTIT